MGNLIKGECLSVMAKDIPDNSVDAVICDLPYGTTSCKWDSVINLEKLWSEYHRVCKENAPIILFASQPFTTTLAASNLKEFKYSLVYQKTYATAWAMAKKRPMKDHEDILVFYKKQPTYNPQMVYTGIPNPGYHSGSSELYGGDGKTYDKSNNSRGGSLDRYPRSVLGPYGPSKSDLPQALKDEGYKCHPTQKQQALLKWLVESYTNPGDVVLDNTMGSGSTGVACKELNRGFIGIEMEDAYFEMAKKWLSLP